MEDVVKKVLYVTILNSIHLIYSKRIKVTSLVMTNKAWNVSYGTANVDKVSYSTERWHSTPRQKVIIDAVGP